MAQPPRIGFIGFGEAGSNIAKGLRASGAGALSAFDIKTDDPQFGPTIRKHAAETSTTLLKSPAELAAANDVLLSLVTASSADNAAAQTVKFLEARHLYADLNSISPDLKRRIGEMVTEAGATFVEAAVMAPVPPYAHRVPMLLGGPGAPRFLELMSPFGMRLEVVSDQVGMAAAVKMCRSIVVKGLEALLFECVLGASRYNADQRVFASLAETFPGIDWNKLADYMVGRAVVHGERRAREMEEVSETLRAIGIEPMMAEATARRQDWSAKLDLRSHFGPEGPNTYREVLDVLKSDSKL